MSPLLRHISCIHTVSQSPGEYGEFFECVRPVLHELGAGMWAVMGQILLSRHIQYMPPVTHHVPSMITTTRQELKRDAVTGSFDHKRAENRMTQKKRITKYR